MKSKTDSLKNSCRTKQRKKKHLKRLLEYNWQSKIFQILSCCHVLVPFFWVCFTVYAEEIIPHHQLLYLKDFFTPDWRFEKLHQKCNRLKVGDAELWLISLVAGELRLPVDWQHESLATGQPAFTEKRLTCCRSRFWRWPAAWARSARPAVACRTGSANAIRWGRTSFPALKWTSRACRSADTSQTREWIQDGGPLCGKPITDRGTGRFKLRCRFLGFMLSSVFKTSGHTWDLRLDSQYKSIQ